MWSFSEAVEITRHEWRVSDRTRDHDAPATRAAATRPLAPSIPAPEVLSQLSYPALLDLSFEVAAGILSPTQPSRRN
jgi:hypothetical protein